MSQIANVNVKQEWTTVKSLVSDDWDFTADVLYQIENTGNSDCFLVESATEPSGDTRAIGVCLQKGGNIVRYIKRTTPLWATASGDNAWLNITAIGD